jgi:hypothetical protein
MKKLWVLVLVLVGVAGASGGVPVADPLAHFKSEWDLEGVGKIYRLEVDLNNDGRKEVLLSTGKSEPAEGREFGWQLYVGKEGGGYVVAGRKGASGEDGGVVPGFRKDQYRVGFIEEINGHGLLYLSCGSGGQVMCQLGAIVIDGDGWKEVAIGEAVNAEAHYAELAKRFASPPVPAVEELVP